MQPWQSDSLCRIATGGGFSSRQLYSDDDEKLFEAARPIILNGIDSVITRADLADRSLFITFDPIPDRARKLENELWADFERARPRIMGALFEACARGLREFPLTRLDGFPRMADFAKWAMACEAALWPAGTFACAYRNNRADIVSDVLDADPVATALQQYVLEKKGEPPTQTASALLGALTEIVSNQVSKSKGWPATPKTLSDKLRRAAPFLRKQGINIEWRREGKASTRIIRIYTDLDWDGKLASASSASSAIGNEEVIGHNILIFKTVTAADAADANICPRYGGTLGPLALLSIKPT
jgi:hypothetical protein